MAADRARHGLSRRELLRTIALAGVGLVAAACSSVPSAPAATSSPKRGGTLTWGQSADSATIDPALSSGSAATEIIGNLFDPLVSVDSSGEIRPGLATSWTIEDDATRYRFTLRDGVKFHDGTAFEADAMKRTLERILDPRTKAAQAATHLSQIAQIEAPDPRTLVVTMKAPHPLFLLSLWRPWFGPVSPKLLDALQPGDVIAAPIGTGPYKLAGRSADGVTTLEAFSEYKWGPDLLRNRAAPYLASMKLRSITDASTRVSTLESGENLLVDDLPETDYGRLKDDPRFSFVQVARKGLGLGFFINVQKPPTDELAVRQALNWAVDRKGIVDKLFFGIHRPAAGPLSEGVWGRLDDLDNSFTYDPAKAQSLLEGAGWTIGTGGIREKNGQKLTLTLAALAGANPQNELAATLQLQYRAIGVELQIEKLTFNNWLDFTRSYKHHLCDSAGTNFDPDELRIRYHSSSIKAVNYANLADPQLDSLLVQGSRQPLGSAERRQTYADVQKRLMELLPMVSVITQVRTMAMAKRVHDLVMGPTGLNAQAMSDLWLDS